MDKPKLSTCIWLSILCAVWFVAGATLYVNFSIPWPWIIAAIFIELIWIISSGVNWVYWMWAGHTQLTIDQKRAESMTPFTEAGNLILRLSKEQLDFLGWRGYHAMVGVIGTHNGPLNVLITPWGNVPMSIVKRELRRSGLLRLPRIRDYSDGSPEREYLRIIIKWAVDAGLAHDPNGPEPAMWIDKDSRNIAAGMLGIDLYGNGNGSDNGNGDDNEQQ